MFSNSRRLPFNLIINYGVLFVFYNTCILFEMIIKFCSLFPTAPRNLPE
uniref:Uncharacterized protein n=1 Tax=Parascaris univalens TaxID=6257 RepID=A0A914ZSI6_PARUN